MRDFIRLTVIPFLVLVIFQCGFIYGILLLIIGKVNPLDWHPVIYTLFFEVVLFIIYTSYKASTEDDDIIDIEGNHFNYRQDN
jgi:hypothetical protein